MAVSIKAGKNDTTGDVEFCPPVFSLVETTAETDAKALQIDAEILQPYLASYFGKPKSEQISSGNAEPEPEEIQSRHDEPTLDEAGDAASDDSDRPF
jgi:hypothetical protein